MDHLRTAAYLPFLLAVEIVSSVQKRLEEYRRRRYGRYTVRDFLKDGNNVDRR